MKPEIEVGQVYRDKDKRMEGRHLLVVECDGSYAYCVSATASGREINKRRHSLRVLSLQKRFELVEKCEPGT